MNIQRLKGEFMLYEMVSYLQSVHHGSILKQKSKRKTIINTNFVVVNFSFCFMRS